jgi:hypothetical protein
MVLAVGLFTWGQMWLRTVARHDDMPGPSPADTLLFTINGPIGVLTGYWGRWLPPVWSMALYIAGVGALWYWVALNITHWPQRKTLYLFRYTPLRIGTDLLMLCFSPLLLFFGVGRPFPFDVLSALAVACSFIWFFAWIFFAGRDLILCISRKRLRPARRSLQ